MVQSSGEAWILTSALKHLGRENGQSMDVVSVHTRLWEAANFCVAAPRSSSFLQLQGWWYGVCHTIRQDAEL